MKTSQLISKSEQETIDFGQKLAGKLKAGDIVCLSGELGAGKTTLVKGLAQGLKINPAKVHSPTFTLMNIYEGKFPLYHFDLYRMDDVREIFNIGYEEFLYGDGVSVVEWAEKLKALKPHKCIQIKIIHKKEKERIIEMKCRNE